jgi:hypothetical protein
VVRQGSAKPCTPVRFRVPPLGVAKYVRAISSGGERFLDAEEVSGSNPLSPTLESLLDTLKTPRKGKPPVGAGGFTTPIIHQRYAVTLSVFGILHFRVVYFEGVFHGAGGCVSHTRYHVRVGIEGDGYVGVS